MTKENQAGAGYRRLWSDVLRWLIALDEAMDTSETAILERRVKALEQAVVELRRASGAQPDPTASPLS